MQYIFGLYLINSSYKRVYYCENKKSSDSSTNVNESLYTWSIFVCLSAFTFSPCRGNISSSCLHDHLFSFLFVVSINVSHFVMKPLFGLGRSIHLCAFLLVAYIVFVLINLKEWDHLIPVFKLKSG